VDELSGLRRATGLSLAALASRTPFSKSAWHRYLAGDHLPPRSAVEALARLAGASPAGALELWEAANASPLRMSDAAANASDHESAETLVPTAPKQRHRYRSLKWIVAGAVAVSVTAAATVAASWLFSPVRDVGHRAGVHCHAKSCEGRLPDFSTCARDAHTQSTITEGAFVLKLRFSPACGAAWSEIQILASEARKVSVRSEHDEFSASYPGDGSDGYCSPMIAVPSPRGVVACAEAHGKVACTGLAGPQEAEPSGWA
jgi:transcriptional regulator with XRE-family HTH domain